MKQICVVRCTSVFWTIGCDVETCETAVLGSKTTGVGVLAYQVLVPYWPHQLLLVHRTVLPGTPIHVKCNFTGVLLQYHSTTNLP